MDESLYRGFDERAHVFFTTLMGRLDRTNPDQKALMRIFMSEVARCLPLPSRDTQRLEKAFNFTYRAHKSTPVRESGEAYIFHLVRSSLVIAWGQQHCGVYDLETIVDDLLHDCVEEAGKQFYSRLLTHSRVRLDFGWKTARDVYTLTKHKERGETNEEYNTRLATCDEWRPPAVKIGGDRTDNMWTIGGVSHERRTRKIRETEEWFPPIVDRLRFLVEREIAEKKLAPAENWRTYVTFISGYLWYAVAMKKREFNIP